jgi:hypothetical protein
MKGAIMLGYVAYPVGCCFDAAKRDGDMSGEHINRLWRERFATDARYKIRFCASTDNTFMVQVGEQKVLVTFIDGITYARNFTHSNLYERKPCFQCCEVYNNYVRYHANYQYDVLI